MKSYKKQINSYKDQEVHVQMVITFQLRKKNDLVISFNTNVNTTICNNEYC